MTMSQEVGKLEEEALKRRERLKNLKRKVDDKPEPENNADEENKQAVEIPK